MGRKDEALKVKSVVDRVQRYLGEIVDFFQRAIQKKVEYMGQRCKCDPKVIGSFTEEVVRGTLFFSVSMILKKIEAPLRKAADLPEWITISPGKKQGRVVLVETIREVQFETYKEETILMTRKIDGDEEVPAVQTFIHVSLTQLQEANCEVHANVATRIITASKQRLSCTGRRRSV